MSVVLIDSGVTLLLYCEQEPQQKPGSPCLPFFSFSWFSGCACSAVFSWPTFVCSSSDFLKNFLNEIVILPSLSIKLYF